MFGGFRVCSAFETHIGNDRRNAAALKKPFFRLKAGQGGFDDFHGGGSHIVFRSQSDDGTATMKNIANELESGGAHQAVGVNAESDVVNNLAAMHVFQFVGELTESVKTAGGGITFQGMDGAANPANDFLVRGTSFELQSRFIEGLKDLVGALKEKSPQLAAAIVGGTTHVVTSLRW